ncbi:bacterio-opsin activator domain-containing protein [Halosimplex salinum]|uniref:bacterio-opsin activator domain-containing protein n=1 Tax=Halosimplex salinum TaxID=1710538 RepID=UPI0013DDFA1C|nr:bacterio-opsin activator domain-containing protein [Halosimplex salinum]
MTARGSKVEQYRSLVETVPDGVYILDAESRFTSVNEGMVDLTGYTRDELLGASVSLILSDETMDQVAERRTYLAEHPEDVLTAQYDLYTKAGAEVPVEVRFRALEFDEEFSGTAGVIRDVSDRLDRQREIERQRNELDELNRINAVIRDIDQALVTAGTRDEIEQAVCDRLAAADQYVFAWIAEYGRDSDAVVPRAWAGAGADDFGDVLDASDTPSVEQANGATALRTETVQTLKAVQNARAFAPWHESAGTQDLRSMASIPLVYGDVEYGVLAVYSGRSSAFDDRETEVLGELGETISHAIAALESEKREQSLTALHESTRGLLHTEMHDDIGRLVVERAVSDLALSGALLYRFDDTENALVPAVSAGDFTSETDVHPTFRPGDDSPVWTGFVDGESSTADDIEAFGLDSVSAPMRSVIAVPLGEHGVFVGASEVGAFDRSTRKLVDLLAATAEAAFDRVEGETELRERDERLREQNEQLVRLNRLNELIRDVDQGLVQATTRQEIETVVCDRLTGAERFRFAWIGEQDSAADRVVPRAWSGAEGGYLDSVSLETDGETGEPSVETIRTGEVTSVPNVATDLRSAPWRAEAFSREFQSVVSVPLSYGEFSFGGLTVYTDEVGLFDEVGQAVFAELGQTVANAINAVETKEALLTDRVVELDFRLHDDTQSFLPRLATQIDAEIEFEGIVPVSEESSRIIFTVRGASPESVRSALDASVSVESYRLVAEDDEALYEATVAGPTIATTLAEHGGSPQTISVRDGTVHIVIELPQSADVREFVETFHDRYAGAEFVARRDRERSMQTRQEFRVALEETLTDRQLEVLKTAFYSGYFESPRRTSGQELAESLRVSAPTVSGHLRAAERKFLSLVFDHR